MVYRKCTFCNQQKDCVWIGPETADGYREKACQQCFDEKGLGKTGEAKIVIGAAENVPEKTEK